MGQQLRRGVGHHLVDGDASINAALRLQKLYGLHGASETGWTSVFWATADIQGDPTPVPYMTRAEAFPNKPASDVSQPNKLTSADQPVGSETFDDVHPAADGSEISLTSEKVPHDKSLTITMRVYHEPPNFPAGGIPGSLPNDFEVDVATVLATFDATRADKDKGTQAALLELFDKPSALFAHGAVGMASGQLKVQGIIDTIISKAEIEQRLSTLPGVVG